MFYKTVRWCSLCLGLWKRFSLWLPLFKKKKQFKNHGRLLFFIIGSDLAFSNCIKTFQFILHFLFCRCTEFPPIRELTKTATSNQIYFNLQSFRVENGFHMCLKDKQIIYPPPHTPPPPPQPGPCISCTCHLSAKTCTMFTVVLGDLPSAAMKVPLQLLWTWSWCTSRQVTIIMAPLCMADMPASLGIDWNPPLQPFSAPSLVSWHAS